jgi:hypothetical protein
MQKKVLGEFEEAVGLLKYLNPEGEIQIGDLTLFLDDKTICRKLKDHVGNQIGILRTNRRYLIRRVENP